MVSGGGKHGYIPIATNLPIVIAEIVNFTTSFDEILATRLVSTL